jgi:hypothetical protein
MPLVSDIVAYLKDHQELLWWLGASSVVTFLLSLVLVPWMLAQLPADYFSHQRRHRTEWSDRHPFVRFLFKAGKNVGGFFLFVTGLFMFVLPGQGLITMFAGLVLMDFPGKYRLERWAVNREPVIKVINWLRARFGKPPLETFHFNQKVPPPEPEAGLIESE